MPVSTAARRLTAMLVTAGVAAGGLLATAQSADAAVVRPFTLNYDQEVYGDVLVAGNGSMVCPTGVDPVDPFGEPIATCATAQDRTYTAAAGINDSYYMRWSDVDADVATYNSSSATITIPDGASVDFARLNWSGDTGTIRLADGTVSPSPGCNTRQFLGGAGTAVLPSGTPESTSVRLAVGADVAVAVAPEVISRDGLANVPNSQPQYYAAHATVTSQFTGAPTGAPLTVTLGNVWTPQGFGCYAGWSLDLVYAYDAPDATNAPVKREIFIYDGHVRQSSADLATTTTISGFRAAGGDVQVSLTGYEGDFNISGDQFSVNAIDVTEPLSGGTTTNFFVSNAENAAGPTVANMSVDAKQFTTSSIAAGDTSADLTFSTSGDTYLAQNLVLSVPVSSMNVSVSETSTGPYRPGDTVTFSVTVVSPGADMDNVEVTSAAFDGCDASPGTLTADVPVTYSCTGPAPADDVANVVVANGEDTYSDPITASASEAIEVINPAISITKTADQATYEVGDTIPFTILVENTGDADLTGITVTDSTVPGCDTTRPTLVAGDSFDYTCTATAPLDDDANSITVTATDPLNGPVSDTDTESAPTVGSITGQVFSDRGDDGTLDVGDGDTAISGVTVALTGTTAGNDPVSETTTTGTAGGTLTPPDTTTAIVLAARTDATGYLFGEYVASSISGQVVDDDGDGINGVQLVLTDTDDEPVGDPVVTDGDGDFSFTDLLPGAYTLTEVQPAAYGDGPETAGTAGGDTTVNDVISGIVLSSGTAATGYVFTEDHGSVIGIVFRDDDGDGFRDDDEPGIENVTVTLTYDGVLTSRNGGRTTTTDENGWYVFDGVLAGTYTLTETHPEGYLDGIDTPGTAGGTLEPPDTITGIDLEPGEEATDYLFGEYEPASISGQVVDDDGNGISGVQVTLSGPSIATPPVTDDDGNFSFTGLAPGAYTLTEVQPVVYGDGPETAGTAGGDTTVDDVISEIVLVSGTEATGYVFAEDRGSLSGVVCRDDNDNGTQDGDEPGIEGVTLTLNYDGPSIGGNGGWTTTTDEDGAYTFEGTLAGRFSITETHPDGYADGTDTPGTAGGTLSPPDGIDEIDLDAGEDATGYLFCEVGGQITGTVFVDLDSDGVIDAGEDGRLSGVTIVLTDTEGDELASTVTDEDGAYLFDGVSAGDYEVREEQPEGFGSSTSNVVEVSIEPGGGGNADFGDERGLIGDRVWDDTDGDGLQDDGEPGVEGVAVALLDADGAELTGATTDSYGRYRFADLPTGTYRVAVTLPSGTAFTEPGVGDDGSFDSDIDWVSGRSGLVEIALDGDDITRRNDLDAGLVTRVLDLTPDLSVDQSSAEVGEPVVFTATVANTGTAPVTGARVTITVPDELAIESAGGESWDCTVDGQRVRCVTAQVVVPGESTTPITVETLAIEAIDEITAWISVTLADGSADDVPGNDLDEATVAITPPGTEVEEPALAETGARVLPFLAAGLLLLLAGAGVLRAGRRRQRDGRETD